MELHIAKKKFQRKMETTFGSFFSGEIKQLVNESLAAEGFPEISSFEDFAAISGTPEAAVFLARKLASSESKDDEDEVDWLHVVAPSIVIALTSSYGFHVKKDGVSSVKLASHCWWRMPTDEEDLCDGGLLPLLELPGKSGEVYRKCKRETREFIDKFEPLFLTRKERFATKMSLLSESLGIGDYESFAKDSATPESAIFAASLISRNDKDDETAIKLLMASTKGLSLVASASGMRLDARTAEAASFKSELLDKMLTEDDFSEQLKVALEWANVWYVAYEDCIRK